MTTIAYRDGELCADTQCSAGGVITGETIKIVRTDDGVLSGGTGEASWCHAFNQWVLGGRQGDHPRIPVQNEEPLASGFVIAPDGAVTIYESNGILPLTGRYHAWGSGREFALGAMFVGASAQAAVAAAIQHCTGTGGSITRLTHEA